MLVVEKDNFRLKNDSAKNKQKIIPSDHKELIRGIVRFKDGLEKSVENYFLLKNEFSFYI